MAVTTALPWAIARARPGSRGEGGIAMADRVRKVGYFKLSVPRRAGQGARILGALRDAGVSLLAFSGFPRAGQAQIDLVIDRPAALRGVARREGWRLVGPKRGFLVQGTDQVGAVHRHLQKLADAVRSIVRDRAAVRTQSPFLAFPYSVPEPDVAVVPGRAEDYWERHPTSALLVVEVSNTSLKQDRLSKSRIYVGAAIPEYWIVNLRGDCIEVFRSPDRERRIYVERFTAQRGETLAPIAFPDGSVAVEALLPPPRPRFED